MGEGASLIQLPEDTSYLKHKSQPRLSFIKMRAAGGKPPKVQGVICTVLSGSEGKESTCNAGDPGSIPPSVRSPGKGHGNPQQYSCLENPMDRGTWQATVHGSQRVGHN